MRRLEPHSQIDQPSTIGPPFGGVAAGVVLAMARNGRPRGQNSGRAARGALASADTLRCTAAMFVSERALAKRMLLRWGCPCSGTTNRSGAEVAWCDANIRTTVEKRCTPSSARPRRKGPVLRGQTPPSVLHLSYPTESGDPTLLRRLLAIAPAECLAIRLASRPSWLQTGLTCGRLPRRVQRAVLCPMRTLDWFAFEVCGREAEVLFAC